MISVKSGDPLQGQYQELVIVCMTLYLMIVIVKNSLNKNFDKPEPMLVGTWEAIMAGYYLIHNNRCQTKSERRKFLACYMPAAGR